MSNAPMNAVWRHSQSVGVPRLVLLAMADEANDEGMLTAYRRSQSHLARKAAVSVRTVQRAIAALVDLGEIEVLTKGDGRASTDYRLLLPGLETEGRQSVTPAPGSRGDNLSPLGRQSDTPGATTVSPPSSPSSPVSPRRSARATADAAAGQLPLVADPQDDPQPVDSPDPMALPWKLVRETHDARSRKPIQSRKATVKVVRLLLDGGWTEAQVRAALLSSPSWTPTSLEVELTRVAVGQPRGGGGRARALADDPRRHGESRVVNIAEEIRRGR